MVFQTALTIAMATLHFKKSRKCQLVHCFCTLVLTDIGWLYQSMKTQRLLTIKCHPKSGTRSTCCFDLRHKKKSVDCEKTLLKNLSQLTCMCMPDLMLSGYNKWYVHVMSNAGVNISKGFFVKYSYCYHILALYPDSCTNTWHLNNQIYV